jgi:hypothetical protein
MKELWLPVSGYEGRYEVSSCGRVRGLSRQVPHIHGSTRTVNGRVLKTSEGRFGHNKPYTRLTVSLLKPGCKRWQAPVNRLVAIAFVPNPHQLPVVRHLDGNSLNNKAENLSWGTHKENSEDALQAGATPCGEQHFRARLTEEAARIIKATPRSAVNAKKLGERFGVHCATIRSVWTGQSWAWVTQ